MKFRMFTLVGLVALLGSSVTFGTPAQGGVLGAKKQVDIKIGQGHDHHGHHPELDKAMHLLRDARAALQSGSQDYHGHRQKAMDIADRAIKEVQAAIDSDKH